MKIFFDTEFTGLHQRTTLISIGLVSEGGREFYGELTDYDVDQVDDWIKDNVIANLIYKSEKWALGEPGGNWAYTDGAHTGRRGDKAYIAQELTKWLAEHGNRKIEMWSDCLAYDWVLFCNLWGHAFNIPGNIYYIPFDLSTLFKLKGIDPDIDREKFAGITDGQSKHNALWDARVIKACYEIAMDGT
jgi:hypothetical protein